MTMTREKDEIFDFDLIEIEWCFLHAVLGCSGQMGADTLYRALGPKGEGGLSIILM